MQPYIAERWLCKRAEFYPIGSNSDIDWTLIGVASQKDFRYFSRSSYTHSLVVLGLLALIMCLIGIGFAAFVDQTLTRPSDHI